MINRSLVKMLTSWYKKCLLEKEKKSLCQMIMIRRSRSLEAVLLFSFSRKHENVWFSRIKKRDWRDRYLNKL